MRTSYNQNELTLFALVALLLLYKDYDDDGQIDDANDMPMPGATSAHTHTNTYRDIMDNYIVSFAPATYLQLH